MMLYRKNRSTLSKGNCFLIVVFSLLFLSLFFTQKRDNIHQHNTDFSHRHDVATSLPDVNPIFFMVEEICSEDDSAPWKHHLTLLSSIVSPQISSFFSNAFKDQFASSRSIFYVERRFYALYCEWKLHFPR